MLEVFKNYENVVQNCEANYNAIEVGSSQAIVKVTLKYESFSVVNFVTLANSNKGWKITSISSSCN